MVLLKLAWLMLSGTATAQVRTTVLGQEDSMAAYIPYFFREAPPAIQLPEVDVAAARREDQRRQGRPPRYGLKSAVDLTQDDGRFYELDEATVAWKLRLRSPGATSLNFVLRDFSLPPGGQLYLYDRGEGMVMGPIVPEVIFEATYATDMIFGDEVILLALLPAEWQQDFSLRVTQAVHGYRSSVTRGYGDSEFCTIDVNCPLGVGWEDERDAVARIVAGIKLGSGILVNNACQNYQPLLLTSFDLIDDNENGKISIAEQNAVSTWVLRFNYETPPNQTGISGCRGPEPNSWLSYSGAAYKAGWDTTGFALVELEEEVVGQESLALAGWDRGGTTPTNSTIISHPQGDVKKIARDFDPANAGNWGGITGNHYWINDEFDLGVPGLNSPGAPMFDQNQKIVGLIRWEDIECPSSPDSSTYVGRTWSGRLVSSWFGGGTSNTGLFDLLGGNSNPIRVNTIRLPFIDGPDFTCFGHSNTYNLESVEPVAGTSVDWSVAPANAFGISSGTGTTANLNPNSSSSSTQATLTFNITRPNGCGSVQVSKDIWVGRPLSSAGTLNGPTSVAPDVFSFYTVSNSQPANSNGFYWTFPLGWQVFSGGNIGNGYPHAWAKSPNSGGDGWVQVRPANPCGYGSTSAKWVNVEEGGSGGPQLRQERPKPSPKDGMMLVFPNPSQGYLSVALREDYDKQEAHFKLIDLTGRVHLSGTIYSGFHQLDLGKLSSGVYLLQVVGQGEAQTMRFTLVR